MKERTFHVSNFGCRASQSEGAAITQELLDSKAVETDSVFEAAVVVVNTCTVTEEADREARQLIRRISTRNPQAKIIVTGCYAQRAAEELADMPHVRLVVGNSHKPLVGQLALKVLDTGAGEEHSPGRAEVFCSDIFLETALQTHAHAGSNGRTRAIVKVQDGCNANCSFCVIPSVRGRSRSLAPMPVLDEIRELVQRGYKEVVLSGIHLGSYGRDLEPRTSFAALISSILKHVPELPRLRLSSIEPLEVTPEILDLAAAEPRIARHFHIPLQSGSRHILREMRRPYGPEYYRDLVERIRTRFDDAAIGADVMVGFPGETDAEFMETVRLIEDSPLTYLHVFPFSARPGTVAAALQPEVPARAAQFRARTLRELISRKNAAFRSQFIGRDLDVLVLETHAGLSSNFLRVEVPAELPVNEWVKIRIAGAENDALQGVSRTTTAQEISLSCVSET